jgi:hypothetical protein
LEIRAAASLKVLSGTRQVSFVPNDTNELLIPIGHRFFVAMRVVTMIPRLFLSISNRCCRRYDVFAR